MITKIKACKNVQYIKLKTATIATTVLPDREKVGNSFKFSMHASKAALSSLNT